MILCSRNIKWNGERSAFENAKLFRFQFCWEGRMQHNVVEGARRRRVFRAINNKRMRLRVKSIEKLCKKAKYFFFLQTEEEE